MSDDDLLTLQMIFDLERVPNFAEWGLRDWVPLFSTIKLFPNALPSSHHQTIDI